jgi:hypothetical protein
MERRCIVVFCSTMRGGGGRLREQVKMKVSAEERDTYCVERENILVLGRSHFRSIVLLITEM